MTKTRREQAINLIEVLEVRAQRWAWDIVDGDDASDNKNFVRLQEAKVALINFICGEDE